MHLLCTCFYIVLIFKKIPICGYFCNYMYNYTVDPSLNLNPPLNLPIPPNLSLTLPISHLNSSKSVMQYSMNTINTLYLYLKKYLYVVISVITCIITPLTHPLHLNPPLNLPIPPNLSLTLPISHLNSSKSVMQYSMNTINTLYLYLKKYLYVVISVITCIITPLTHPLHLNPPLNLPIPPNLSLTLPISHLNSSKSVMQYSMNTISTLHLFF